jgi:hypothetical protein
VQLARNASAFLVLQLGRLGIKRFQLLRLAMQFRKPGVNYLNELASFPYAFALNEFCAARGSTQSMPCL